jgi:parallel beta-helix repeat protein
MATVRSSDHNKVTHEVVAAPGQAVDIVSVKLHDGTKVLTVDRDGLLQDVAVPVSSLGAGQLALSAMPRAASGVLTAKGVNADPAYEALDINSILTGQLALSQMPRGADGGFLAGKGVTVDPEYRTIALNDLPEGTGVLKGVGGHPTYQALTESDIPNISASKITSGNLALARLATGTGFLKASGGAPGYASIALADLPTGSGFLASAGGAPAYRTLLAGDIPSLPATILTSATIDGDRLPAMSASKKGAVPPTGTPSGLYLRDDGTWAAPEGGGGGGSGSGGLGNYKFLVFKDGATYKALTPSGTIASSSASASTVINYALTHLTSGRSWKEKVTLLGDITLDSRMEPESYTIIEVIGRVFQAASANQQMLYASSETAIEIFGGEWDGNQANQDVDGVTVYGSDCCGIHLVGCTDVVLHDLVIHDSPYDNILLTACQHALVDRVTSHHAGTYENGPSWLGHGIMAIGSHHLRICNCHIHDTASGGIYCYTETDEVAESVSHCSLVNNLVERTMTSGLSISLRGAEDTGSYDVIMGNQCVDCGMDGMHPSINLGYGAGMQALYGIVLGNTVSQTGAYDCGEGITLHCSHCVVLGNTIHHVKDGGIVLGAGDHNIIANNNIHDLQGETTSAIFLHAGSYNNIYGNVIANIPITGIYITPESEGDAPSYNWVHDNLVQDCGVAWVRVAEAESVGNIVERNHFAGSGSFLNTGISTVVRDNRGLATENAGTATISSGTSSIAVSHGLATTPRKIVVTGSSADTAALYVTSIGSSNFTVNAAGNVGGDRTVYWRAEY